jgi:hypothetical protein
MAMLQTTEKAKPTTAPKPGAAPADGGSLTPEALQAKMHLTPQQSAQLDRIVTAGKKVMFSKDTHHLMLEQLDGPGTIGQKIGNGVAGLVALLWQESQRSIPPMLLIPAGVVLCAVVAQFLKQAGQGITDQDIGNAIETMTNMLLSASGTDPDKLANAGAGKASAPAPDDAAAANAGEGENA